MSASIRWVFDSAKWTAGVGEVRTRLSNLPPALRAIARAGVASTRRRFQTGSAPDGTPWKKGRKKTGQTLIVSSLLLRSVSDRPPEANAVEWGSNRQYAGVHQFGFNGTVQVSAFTRVVRKIFGRPTKAPVVQSVRAHARKMDVPARSYLGVSNEDGSTFANILLRYAAQPLTGGPGIEGGAA